MILFVTSATKESVGIEELVDDFVTFYIAGQETTSSMLTFALVQTLLHPNVLERCVSTIFYRTLYYNTLACQLISRLMIPAC